MTSRKIEKRFAVKESFLAGEPASFPVKIRDRSDSGIHRPILY
jgi:hypothetical protein